MRRPQTPRSQFAATVGCRFLFGQRISTPDVAERVLAEGAADLIGMVRAFFADPAWITKTAAGEASRIRPCLNLNQDCRAFSPRLHCAVNPVVGRETTEEFRELRPAAHTKQVAVIGGGPGGLEAALTAARRGHRVAVFEATESFGGQFLYAASVPHRHGLRRVDRPPAERTPTAGSAASPGRPHRSPCGPAGRVRRSHRSDRRMREHPLTRRSAASGAVRWFDVLDQGAPEPTGNGHAVFVDDGSGFWWNYGVAEALVEAVGR